MSEKKSTITIAFTSDKASVEIDGSFGLSEYEMFASVMNTIIKEFAQGINEKIGAPVDETIGAFKAGKEAVSALLAPLYKAKADEVMKELMGVGKGDVDKALDDFKDFLKNLLKDK